MDKRYKELNKFLCDSSVLENRQLLESYNKEHGKLEETISAWQKYEELQKEIDKLQKLLSDQEEKEIHELAEEEKEELEIKLENVEGELLKFFSSKDS